MVTVMVTVMVMVMMMIIRVNACMRLAPLIQEMRARRLEQGRRRFAWQTRMELIKRIRRAERNF